MTKSSAEREEGGVGDGGVRREEKTEKGLYTVELKALIISYCHLHINSYYVDQPTSVL